MPSFAEFLARIRAGDDAAAEELVRRYEPALRAAVRVHLSSAALRRQLDSMDVCQSVLGSFFARVALGQYEFTQAKELLALLVRMTRNKLASQARHHLRECRDARRVEGGQEALGEALDSGPEPWRIVAGHEMLRELRARLSPEERGLADRRADGQGWPEIARSLGGTAEGRRKQLARAITRVAPELGLTEEQDDDE